MNKDYILETRGLSKSFGALQAVTNVDLRVERRGVHALIGPNGAGKTTFFNLLTKFLPSSSGTITFDGRDITAARPEDIARHGMVRSFQISAVFPRLSCIENVRIGLQRSRGESFDFWRSQKILDRYNDEALALLHSVGLSVYASVPAGALSYGRKRALEIATTLALSPKLLLLDEPLAGLGQEDIGRIADLIRRLGHERTILMVEHNLSVVAALSSRITVLARGKVLAEGDFDTVSRDPRVLEAYIGRGHA